MQMSDEEIEIQNRLQQMADKEKRKHKLVEHICNELKITSDEFKLLKEIILE